jgi:hypothetical protein
LGFPIQNRKREASLYRACAHMDASCAAQRAHFRRQRQSARSQGLRKVRLSWRSRKLPARCPSRKSYPRGLMNRIPAASTCRLTFLGHPWSLGRPPAQSEQLRFHDSAPLGEECNHPLLLDRSDADVAAKRTLAANGGKIVRGRVLTIKKARQLQTQP